MVVSCNRLNNDARIIATRRKEKNILSRLIMTSIITWTIDRIYGNQMTSMSIAYSLISSFFLIFLLEHNIPAMKYEDEYLSRVIIISFYSIHMNISLKISSLSNQITFFFSYISIEKVLFFNHFGRLNG